MAGYTSGGEQQMCAIGRALMSRPKMILLDEPSMGLAPQIVEEIFEIVKNLNEKEGVSFLLAEQNTNMALRYARYGYILENGRVVLDGDAKALRENEDVKEFYLGIAEGKRKSFRDGKHYRRRKRWLALGAINALGSPPSEIRPHRIYGAGRRGCRRLQAHGFQVARNVGRWHRDDGVLGRGRAALSSQRSGWRLRPILGLIGIVFFGAGTVVVAASGHSGPGRSSS